MRRLRFRLLLQPLFRHRRLDTERARRAVGVPPRQVVAREVREVSGMKVAKAEYLFSLPNIYIYSGFPVHTLDMFFRCTVEDTLHFEAMDDAADLFFLPLKDIRTEEFGLGSIRKGVGIFLEDIRKNKSE